MNETRRRRRRGSISREAMMAMRSKPPAVNPAPPGPVGGQYKPLTEHQIKLIYDTSLRMLSELGMGDAPPALVERALHLGQGDEVLRPLGAGEAGNDRRQIQLDDLGILRIGRVRTVEHVLSFVVRLDHGHVVGIAAGTVREAAEFVVPQAFKNAKTYEVLVKNSLTFLTDKVGGVRSTTDDSEDSAVGDDFVARKAVSH